MNNYTLRPITAEEAYTVRLRELRKGGTLEDCRFDGDHLKTTVHLGGFHNHTLVAVGSFLKNDHTLHSLTNAYQLRGMAVLEKYWKKGFGQQLLFFGEQLFSEKNIDFIWMNARKNAFGFYEKLGYSRIGSIFEVADIGTHQVLFKKINQHPKL
ncbi:GNAT family N-acetyltransferase [uncultured Kriegella sp.]|uniref:GNAT family N-acetyltransferase n=1 Tax=uncultured Kriegella sp. TaxID=1798910 RepID=UPI0030D71297|tara:strand:+ start:2973 stop:3434 length:462 start_codon:yes stop_codon:yes gene_type:complete